MTELARPLCGNMGLHAAHIHFTMDGSLGVQCGGWTAEADQVADLMATALRLAYDHNLEGIKDRFRLEMHPGVPNMIARWVRPTFGQAVLGERPEDMLGMPAEVRMDGLSEGQWRIVVARGEISADSVG